METQAEFNPALRDLAMACPEALSDAELMLLICHSTGSGQLESLFSEIFRRYHSKVNSWCFRLTRDRSSALDLTQEVFFKAYRHIGSFRGDSKLSTWLYAITRNHCLSYLKKNAVPIPQLRAGEVLGRVSDVIQEKHGSGHCEMVQRREGLRIHFHRRQRPGRFRALLGNPG